MLPKYRELMFIKSVKNGVLTLGIMLFIVFHSVKQRTAWM